MAPAARSQLAVPSVAYTNGLFKAWKSATAPDRRSGGGDNLHGVLPVERRFERSQIMRLRLLQSLGES